MKQKKCISTISRKKLLKQVYSPDSTAIIDDDDVTGSEKDFYDPLVRVVYLMLRDSPENTYYITEQKEG